ncbi:hypothetical protein ODZ83_05560 [Acaricomes phytoseiuli]|uniref:hypothetical protein n=1 Tax=Acaricomes phytoseiuli TaxID=291968 RepID=UPI00222208EB|nr:hypothetical protein [Acaricomes phytoseiuli]MCW1249658.1 hypothetical protein [Acaricomes phytoseiuli]
MANKLVFDEKALKELRKDPALRSDMKRRGKRLAEAAGGEALGYKVTDLVLEDPRGAVSIMATGKAAVLDRRSNNLVRNLDVLRRN